MREMRAVGLSQDGAFAHCAQGASFEEKVPDCPVMMVPRRVFVCHALRVVLSLETTDFRPKWPLGLVQGQEVRMVIEYLHQPTRAGAADAEHVNFGRAPEAAIRSGHMGRSSWCVGVGSYVAQSGL